MTAVGNLAAARLFLTARGRAPVADEDVKALASLLDEFARAGWRAALEQAQAHYRVLHPGRCKTAAADGGCDCFLCRLDREKGR